MGKSDRIAFVEVPVDLFPFLFVTVLNGRESIIMLVAVVFCSWGRGRKLEVGLGWNTMVTGIACVGLM